jgi:hypothetical protein
VGQTIDMRRFAANNPTIVTIQKAHQAQMGFLGTLKHGLCVHNAS